MSFFLFAVSACSSKSPKLKFVNTEKDIVVSKGKKLDSYFEFFNEGNDTLKFKSVTADCGCTQIEFPKTGIPPGESGKIEFVFDSNLVVDTFIVRNILIEANTIPTLTMLTLRGKINY